MLTLVELLDHANGVTAMPAISNGLRPWLNPAAKAGALLLGKHNQIFIREIAPKDNCNPKSLFYLNIDILFGNFIIWAVDFSRPLPAPAAGQHPFKPSAVGTIHADEA